MTSETGGLARRIAAALVRLLPTNDWTEAVAEKVANSIAEADSAALPALSAELHASRRLLKHAGSRERGRIEDEVYAQWCDRVALILATGPDPLGRAERVLTLLQGTSRIRIGWQDAPPRSSQHEDAFDSRRPVQFRNDRQVAGEAADWYLTVSLPESAPVGRRISLLAQVTLAGVPHASAMLKPLGAPSEGRDVTITVTAPGMIPLDGLDQDLLVPAAADSEPCLFTFKTGRPGLHPVMVRAFTGGTFLGELALEVSVEVGAPVEEAPARSVLLTGLAAEPGEITLQVNQTDDDRYSFQLMGETLYRAELTQRLRGDPAEVVQALADELRALAGKETQYTDPALARDRIRNLGAQLWADIVPESIRRQFWAQAGNIKLFTVASDTDTVPWELLYPADGDHDNGFLVEQYPVVRRVYGEGRTRHLNLSSVAYVVPPGSPANAMEEVEAIRKRLGDGVRDRGVCDRLDSLLGLLEDPPSVLHFACHNAFSGKSGSVVRLEGGLWRPSDLALAAQKRSMARTSPLVFFNACRTASEVPGLTQMMGWARQFMAAGAGAFVGSLWAVRSDSAKAFADTFYRAMVHEGEPLGTASHLARQAIASDGGDPTWLAYTIYGNPSATIRS